MRTGALPRTPWYRAISAAVDRAQLLQVNSRGIGGARKLGGAVPLPAAARFGGPPTNPRRAGLEGIGAVTQGSLRLGGLGVDPVLYCGGRMG